MSPTNAVSIRPAAGEHPPAAPVSGSARLTRNAIVVLAVIAAAWALQWAKPLFVPLVLGAFITFWLTPLVDRLERWRIRRSIGAGLVLILLVGAVVAIAYSVRDDAVALINGLPDAARHAQAIVNDAMRDRDGWLHHLRNALNQVGPLAQSVKGAAAAPAAAAPLAPVDMPATLIHWSRAAIAAVVNSGLVLFLVYFLLAAGDLFKRRLVTAISGGLSRRRITVTMLEQVGQQLQRYLVVLAVTNAVIGILTWLVFRAFGVEHAGVWGVAAAVLHVVPYVGAAAIAAASALVASVQLESITQGLLVGASTLAISTIVGMLLTTWLASRASAMNSAAVFVGLLFWGWLWGIAGLLLGTPLMMAMKVMLDHIAPMRAVSSFMSGSVEEEKALQSRG
ncbi:MAG TPA: AI-2E family transporter [Steroidobacteraceae bacterium]|nr:AI-2E family transporter [Steroidobacteraceae bacterium]